MEGVPGHEGQAPTPAPELATLLRIASRFPRVITDPTTVFGTLDLIL